MGKKTSKKNSEPEEINVLDFIKKLNINYSFLLLLIFVCFGFYLRYYHIDYPVIGYHNWKTAHYITEARNYAREGFFKYGFFVPMRDTMARTEENIDGAHGDTLPITPIIGGFFFKIFGESLVVARMPDILFSVASIVIFYLLIKELFEKELLALLSAFLAAINPLYIYFSHNFQLITAGLFFMLLGLYFYIRWLKHQCDEKKFSNLYLATLFITLAASTKYSFAIIAVPIIFTFPYKKIIKNKNQFIKPLIISALIGSLFIMWYLYAESYVNPKVTPAVFTSTSQGMFNRLNNINISVVFSQEFWGIMRSYLADNFTLIGMTFFVLGVATFTFFSADRKDKYYGYFIIGHLIGLFTLLILRLLNILNLANGFLFISYFIVWTTIFPLISRIIHLTKKGKYIGLCKELLFFGILNWIYLGVIREDKLKFRFILGYLIGFIIFLFIMGFKLSGHNYHQFPVAPLVIFMISYFIYALGNNIANFLKSKELRVALTIGIMVFVIFAIPFPVKGLENSLYAKSIEAKNRMFNTQFPGLDIAGNYIKEHSQPDERIFHSSGQNYGVLWHAERKGYKPPSDVEYFKNAEDNYNVNWVFMYQWGIQSYFGNAEVMNYIRNNYKLVQMAFVERNGQNQPLYMLFRKGGTFNESKLTDMIQGKPQREATYQYTHISYKIPYVNLE